MCNKAYKQGISLTSALLNPSQIRPMVRGCNAILQALTHALRDDLLPYFTNLRYALSSET